MTNDAINWFNDRSVPLGFDAIKPLKTLNRIPSNAKSALNNYLKSIMPDDKQKALGSALTDALGLHTEGKFSPHTQGFWGHDNAYNKDRGKKGAVSETWATFGSMKLDDQKEQIELFKKLMPNSYKAFNEVFDEVADYAMKNDLKY